MSNFSSLFRYVVDRTRIYFESNGLRRLYFRRRFRNKVVASVQKGSLPRNDSLGKASDCFLENHSRPILVIHFLYGGLGDHLLYSHIPRLAKETGQYSKVYISRKTPVRNDVYLKYIWEFNPFVDGFCDETNLVDLLPENGENENILDRIMLSYGIDDGLRWHEPELYFNPPIFPELFKSSIYDPNFISDTGGLNSRMVNNYFLNNNLRINFQFLFRSRRFVPIIEFDEFITDHSFEEFCGIIVSCSNLFLLTTGTATLAAALKKPATVFFGEKLNTVFLHSKQHQYVLLQK